MTSRLIAGLASDLAGRAAAGLARKRRIVESPQGRTLEVDGRDLVSFASNDYLGLAAAHGESAALRRLDDAALARKPGGGTPGKIGREPGDERRRHASGTSPRRANNARSASTSGLPVVSSRSP